jgi:Protein of unknown function (DUF3040)
MLSEQERRALESIERELSSDPCFAASFARAFRHRFRRQLVRPRSVIVFGVLVMIAALLLGLTGTFGQGLLLTVLGVGWWSWFSHS